jgi:hypothetical protein
MNAVQNPSKIKAKPPAGFGSIGPPIPRWARLVNADVGSDELAFLAGAALSQLHLRVMADASFAGAWRRRLALKAAVASASMASRPVTETALRDAFFMRQGNEDPGPAVRLLEAWRALDRSAPLEDDAIKRVLDILGVTPNDGLTSALGHIRRLASSNLAAPLAAAQAASLARAAAIQSAKAELFAFWLADAVLAARLGWLLPLPLLAAALAETPLRGPGRGLYLNDGNWTRLCCAAYARGAATACDLYGQIGPQAAKLLTKAAALRSKRAPAVVQLLLDEDAVVPAMLSPIIPERAARRLFALLKRDDAVRLLTPDRQLSPQYGL